MINLPLLARLCCFFVCIATLQIPVSAQNYNGKGLMWELTTNTNARVSVKFGSTGINVGKLRVVRFII